jgi:hypothetical protein
LASFRIGGTWEGEYWHQPSATLPSPPPAVRFTLTARAGWFGAFRGTIQDDPALGVPEPAAVKGQVVGSAVAFVKRYPAPFVRHGGRCMAFREYVEAVCGLPLDEDVPGPPIVYEGSFDAAGGSASGVWRHDGDQLFFSSDGQLREFPLRGSGGWRMTRLPPPGHP